jgi:superfamily II DNA/RNA helicase
MSFKKLEDSFKERLQELGITEPTEFQKATLSKIKGGINLFGIAPKNSGKSTAIVISTIDRLKKQSIDDAPRAIIIVKDKEAVLELGETFKKFLWGTDLLFAMVYEEQKIHVQQDELYEGVDIVITTPKRLSKLYFMNGINLNKVEVIFVDGAKLLFQNANHADLDRLTQSIKKCQYVLFEDEYDKRMEQFKDSFMVVSQLIELE